MSQSESFDYVLPLLMSHPINSDIQVYKTKPMVVDHEQAHHLAFWRSIFELIEQADDWIRLSTWEDSEEACLPEERQCFYMRILFTEFSKLGIEPFTKCENFFMRAPHVFHWEKLPLRLRYLGDFAERYGKYQFPAEVAAFFDSMTDADRNALDDLLVDVERDFDAINEFLDEFNMTKHQESNHLYFLVSLLAQYNDNKRRP